MPAVSTAFCASLELEMVPIVILTLLPAPLVVCAFRSEPSVLRVCVCACVCVCGCANHAMCRSAAGECFRVRMCC